MGIREEVVLDRRSDPEGELLIPKARCQCRPSQAHPDVVPNTPDDPGIQGVVAPHVRERRVRKLERVFPVVGVDPDVDLPEICRPVGREGSAQRRGVFAFLRFDPRVQARAEDPEVPRVVLWLRIPELTAGRPAALRHLELLSERCLSGIPNQSEP